MTITFDDVVAVVEGEHMKVADRLSKLEKDIGRPLTNDEINRALNCTMCGMSNGSCTHGE